MDMQTSQDSSFTVQAHAAVQQAEDAERSEQFEKAIAYYKHASDLFLMATNNTSDLESIKALKVLSQAQTQKAVELQSKIASRNLMTSQTMTSPAHPSIGTSSVLSSTNQFQHPSESQLRSSTYRGTNSAAQSVMFKQYPQSNVTNQEILSRFANVTPNRTPNRGMSAPVDGLSSTFDRKRSQSTSSPQYSENENNTDLWMWMQGMLDMLPTSSHEILHLFGQPSQPSMTSQPQPQQHQPNRSYPQNFEDLDSSFFLVPNRLNSPSPTHRNGHSHYSPPRTGTNSAMPRYASPPPANYQQLSDAELQALQGKSKTELIGIIQSLHSQNRSLSLMLDQAKVAAEENDKLKRSIMIFRSELEKKASRLRGGSGGLERSGPRSSRYQAPT